MLMIDDYMMLELIFIISDMSMYHVFWLSRFFSLWSRLTSDEIVVFMRDSETYERQNTIKDSFHDDPNDTANDTAKWHILYDTYTV